jgi:hypothetical protein
MNKHMRYIVEEWLPTLDDAALQRIQDAPADQWLHGAFNERGTYLAREYHGPTCLMGHAYGPWMAAQIYVQDDTIARHFDILCRTVPLEAWLKGIADREVTDAIRAEARRLLATRRLAIDVPVASVV